MMNNGMNNGMTGPMNMALSNMGYGHNTSPKQHNNNHNNNHHNNNSGIKRS